MRRYAVLCFLVLSTACTGLERPVSFSTPGGDAWTFDKIVEGTVTTSACDAVKVTSPLAANWATVLGERFTARIKLAQGDNPVEATCFKNGQPRGIGSDQMWSVALGDVPKAVAR